MPRNRRSGGGAGRAFALLFLIGLAVAGGVGVAYREKIFEFLKGRRELPEVGQRPSVVEPRPQPPPEEPAAPATQPPATQLPPPEPVRRPSILAEQAAAERFDAAGKAYRALEFSKAHALAMQAAESVPGSPIGQEALELARRAATFKELVGGIERNPEAAGKLYRLRRAGNDIEVVIEREDNKYYYVLLDNGIRAPIAKEDVLEVVPVPKGSKQQKYLEELAHIKTGQQARGALGQYEAAVFAYRHLLNDEALALLEAAYAESPNLLKEVNDNKALTLFRRALWNDGIGYSYPARKYLEELLEKYPESRHAKPAQQLLADIDARKQEKLLTFAVKKQPATAPTTPKPTPAHKPPETVARPPAYTPPPAQNNNDDAGSRMSLQMEKISVSDPRVQKMLEAADQHFKEGMTHYLAGRPGSGNPNANRELEKAATCFEKAANLYSDASELSPGTKRLEARAMEAARLHYNSIKMQTISGL